MANATAGRPVFTACGCGKRSGALVAYSVEPKFAPLLSSTQCVSQSEVGVSNDPENSVDSTRHQSINELGHERFAVALRLLDPYPDSIRAFLDREARDAVIERPRGLSRNRVVFPAVPREHEPLAFDEPFTEGAALVGAAVRDRPKPFFRMGERNRVVPRLDHGDRANSNGAEVGNFEPGEISGHVPTIGEAERVH
jgi:hypothetical protein